MLYSQLFGKTTKTVPSDAAAVSHKLLWQGGFTRRFSTGRWGLLPLGMRVCQKIIAIIVREMDGCGIQRLEVPTLHPLEIWQKTNRDQAFGEEMMVVKDHYDNYFALGATAEGMMAELVKMFAPSYKDLPLEIYQFSQKFRDDKRPRAGLIRVREFLMKDAYNFCADEKQFLTSYQKFYDAYLHLAKIFELKVTPVLADSGAIGGSVSHEFMLENENGDNTFFVCGSCGYSANKEKCAFFGPKINPDEKIKPFKIIDQPQWVMTMNDNIKHYGEPLWRYLKNVVYKDKQGKIYIASLRGDQDVNETKLKRYLGIDDLHPATENDLAKMGTKHGYVHSWGISNVTYIGDEGLLKVKNFIGGQKEDKTDSVNVNYSRDFKYKHIADIVDAKDGDLCPECKKGKLQERRGYEWGHTFNIGYFYSQPQECNFIDKDGKEKPLWMGSYGIGAGRTMALIVEAHNDQDGIVWPEAVAPFKYHLLALDLYDKKVKDWANKVYHYFVSRNEEILYDDRIEVSAGEKFKDADLIGIPYRLVISLKTTSEKLVEIKKRNEKEKNLVKLEKII